MSWSSNLDIIAKSGEEVRIVGGRAAWRILDGSGFPVTAKPLPSKAEAVRLCRACKLRVAKSW